MFVTPPLQPGQEYTYTLKARWTENGQPVERTRQIMVRPGQTATVDFSQATGAGQGNPNPKGSVDPSATAPSSAFFMSASS